MGQRQSSHILFLLQAIAACIVAATPALLVASDEDAGAINAELLSSISISVGDMNFDPIFSSSDVFEEADSEVVVEGPERADYEVSYSGVDPDGIVTIEEPGGDTMDVALSGLPEGTQSLDNRGEDDFIIEGVIEGDLSANTPGDYTGEFSITADVVD